MRLSVLVPLREDGILGGMAALLMRLDEDGEYG